MRARYAAALAAQAPLEVDAHQAGLGRDRHGSGTQSQMLIPFLDEQAPAKARKPKTATPAGSPAASKRPRRPSARPTPQKRLCEIILAVDPGTVHCGWARLDARSDTLLDSGVIVARGKTLAERLPALRAGLTEIVQGADFVVYEQPFRVGNRGDQALPQIVALLQLAAADANIPVRGIYLSSARKAACGYGSASKEQVAEWMRLKFQRELHARGREWQTHDESDAVCIAVAAAIMNRDDNGL